MGKGAKQGDVTFAEMADDVCCKVTRFMIDLLTSAVGPSSKPLIRPCHLVHRIFLPPLPQVRDAALAHYQGLADLVGRQDEHVPDSGVPHFRGSVQQGRSRQVSCGAGVFFPKR